MQYTTMLPLIINTKKVEVNDFLKKLIKKHDIKRHNIFEIKPLKEEVTINQVRELKRDLLVFQKQKRMIIFFDFDKSGLETQNSLLKILEEKTDQNLFIFLVENAEKIIATIKSRAKIIDLQDKKISLEVDPLIERLVSEIKKAQNVAFLNKKELLLITKEGFLAITNKLIIYFKNELRKDNSSKLLVTKILKKILQITYLVESNNLNPQLAFDNLLIFVWKNYSMKV